ncbi:MAG: hypothetical protein WBL19_00585 [Minisyncoccia bacterium]
MSALIKGIEMKKFFSLSLVLLFASASALAAGSTPSGGGNYISVSRLSSASATFRGGDGGCVETEANVYAERFSNKINQEIATTSTVLHVFSMTRRNVCTNTTEFSAAHWVGPITSFTHVLKKNTDGTVKGTASVVANIQVEDQVSGNSVPVWLNLVWNTFGVRRDNNNEVKETYPEGFYTLTTVRDTQIVSSAVGSVSDGAYEYAEQYQSATWQQAKSEFRTNTAAQ